MVDNETFRAKYYSVIDILRQWLPGGFDFSDSTILDFGCEHGIMSLAFALRLKAKRVVGVDINSLHSELLDVAGDRVGIGAIPPNLEFHRIGVAEKLSETYRFDLIFAWSTFEHVCQPYLDDVVVDLYNSLTDNGYVFVQIAPLYYSPFGSHLEALHIEPWAHLHTQSDLLRNQVASMSKADTRYERETDDVFSSIKTDTWSCYETLNKVTADDVIDLFERNGFVTARQLRTNTSLEPPPSLSKIYSQEILKTEQIVALFQKRSATGEVAEAGAPHIRRMVSTGMARLPIRRRRLPGPRAILKVLRHK